MKNILLLFIIILISCEVSAQNSSKVRFQSITQFGVLQGETGTAFLAQSINGVRFGTWSAGVGVGIDHYASRSVPVFLDTRKSMKENGPSFFFHLSGGKHYIWENRNSEWETFDYKPGLYYDLGIGYSIPLISESLVFSAGYSYKAFEETIESSMCGWAGCQGMNKENFSYKLRRISIKAGFRF